MREIHIPHAVLRELSVIDDQERIIRASEWILLRSPSNDKLVRRLLTHLDLGESEAIALAVETEADYIIVDEQAGRSAVELLGIPIVGLLGVLTEAKTAGHVPVIRPLVQQVIANGFHLDPKLVKTVLAGVQE